jgi:ABC-type nitrate/sulfonate/bicarbonate transport system substrate-binding protein
MGAILFRMLAIAVALALHASPSMAQSLKKTTIVIGSPGFIYTLHYVAVGAGLFKEEGLDVDTVNVSSGPRQVAAVMGGSADVAPTNIEHVVRSTAQGGNIIALSSIFNVSPYVVVLSNKAIERSGMKLDMPIDEKIKRLKGLKIAVTTAGSGADSMLRSLFLARGGVPDKEVTIQPLGTPDGMVTALENNIVDGFVFLAPHSEIPAQKGYGKVVIDPATGEVPELMNVPYLTVVTSRDILKNKQPILKAIVRAYTKAIRFTQEHPEQARTHARQFLKEADEAVFNVAYKKGFTALPTQPVISPGQVENMVRWMNLSAPQPLNVKYEDIIESDLAREAAKDILGK